MSKGAVGFKIQPCGLRCTHPVLDHSVRQLCSYVYFVPVAGSIARDEPPQALSAYVAGVHITPVNVRQVFQHPALEATRATVSLNFSISQHNFLTYA